MNAEQMMANPTARILVIGYPGAGKTSALASLANAGFKLRVLNFEGQPESLLHYADPSKLSNIDVLSFEDKMALQGAVLGPVGMPSAFANAWKALDRWKYKNGEEEIDLGASKDWGADTVVVLDGLTGLSSAAMDYARAAMNKTRMNTTRAVWGVAAANVESFLKRLVSMNNKHHVVVISHLKVIGPEGEQDGDSDFAKELKQAKANVVDTKLFPNAVGRQLPQNVAGLFPVVLRAEVKVKGNKTVRVLSAVPSVEVDLKLPIDLAKIGDMDIETGLLSVFDELKIQKPNTVPRRTER